MSMKINVIWNRTFSVEVESGTDEAIDSAVKKIRSGNVPSVTDSMEFVNDFHEIPSDISEYVMQRIIDRVAEAAEKEEDTISKLINMGFPGEVLIDYFGFNMISVGEVEENIFEKNKDSIYKRFKNAADLRDYYLDDDQCEKLIELCEKEGSSVDDLIRMSDNDIQSIVDEYLD